MCKSSLLDHGSELRVCVDGSGAQLCVCLEVLQQARVCEPTSPLHLLTACVLTAVGRSSHVL